MQISNVLLSNMHPSGIALFDEVDILGETTPALGRRQFERIVTALRKAPGAIDGESVRTDSTNQAKMNNHGGAGSKEFIGAMESIARRRGLSGSSRLGLEGEILRISAMKRSQQKLFVVMTDLTSCREAVIAGSKLCRRTNNKMLVINMYNDWYNPAHDGDEISRYERMYETLDESMAIEKVLRRQGVSFLRVGPADTAPRIVRTIRRGLA